MFLFFFFNLFLWKRRCRFEGNLVLGIIKILSHSLFVNQLSVFATVSSLHFHSVFKCNISIAAVTLHSIHVYSFYYHWNHEKKNSKDKAWNQIQCVRDVVFIQFWQSQNRHEKWRNISLLINLCFSFIFTLFSIYIVKGFFLILNSPVLNIKN